MYIVSIINLLFLTTIIFIRAKCHNLSIYKVQIIYYTILVQQISCALTIVLVIISIGCSCRIWRSTAFLISCVLIDYLIYTHAYVLRYNLALHKVQYHNHHADAHNANLQDVLQPI